MGWLALTDKKRWRSLTMISIVALTSANTAELIVEKYPVWDYIGNEDWLFVSLSNATIYTLAIYLFIQWYPLNPKILYKCAYWLSWTTVSALLELFYVKTGHMIYYPQWCYWQSYIADWLLYSFFLNFYRIFRLERLDPPPLELAFYSPH